MSDETLFHEVRQMPADERAAFLDEACVGNTALRERVEALLGAYDNPGDFLEKAAFEFGATVDLSPAERIGTLIGPYKLLEQIGEGGMGVVYMADQQTPVRRRVALKIIKAGMDSRQVIARFEAERQALALMDHSNIARVFDAGATDLGRPFFVMELVRGIPITEYCDQNNLTIDQRLELFVQVCHAVQHAHQKGIIHRDLKPSNVLVTVNDGRHVPKVIDFGVAKATNQQLTEKTLFTAFAQMIGTPLYMSPEQAEMSSLDIDTRSDIYSLGVLLYELLTGTTPFDRERLRSAAYDEMRRIIREEDPPKPSTRISTLGESRTATAAHRQVDGHRLGQLMKGDLDWIVMKSMEKDRTRRYETAGDFAADVLRHLHDQLVEACPPSVTYRIRKFVRRNRLQVAAAAVVVLALVGGITASILGLVRATRAEHVVLQQNDRLAEERDRAVGAEADARQERAKAESETHAAQLQFADGLISQGDALTSAAEFPNAYKRYAEAAVELQRLKSSLARLDLSLVRLYRASPPPLWTVNLPGGVISAWVVVPARKEIITRSPDNQFYVWDLLTGDPLRSFNGPPAVRCMAVTNSPTGTELITGSNEFVRVIDPSTGVVLRQAEGDRAAGFCSISSDGLLAASGNGTGTITLWETGTLKKLDSVGGTLRGNAATFSHDSAIVATLDGNTVALWDLKTGREIRHFDEANGRRKARGGTNCIAFTADDRALLCAESDGVISEISVDGESLATWIAHNGTVSSLAVTTEGNRLITAGDDGRLRVFDTSFSGDWDPTLTMVVDEAQILGATYVGDTGPKDCLANGGLARSDQGVVVAASAHGKLFAFPLVAPTRFNERVVDGMSMSSDGVMYAGDVLDHVEVRDSATDRTLRILPPEHRCFTSAFSPNSQQLVTGGGGGELESIDLAHSACTWAMLAHDGTIWAMDISSDGNLVASGGDDVAVRIWDTQTGTLVRAMRGSQGQVTGLLFGPESNTNPTSNNQLSMDGRRLIAGDGNTGVLYDWNLGSGAAAKRAYVSGPVREMTISPDKKLLVASTVNKRASLLDINSLQPAGVLGPINSYIYGVRFIDPGTGVGTCAVACCYRQLRVWDMATRKEMLVLDTMSGYGSGANSARPAYGNHDLIASPDGTQVFAKGTGRIDLTLPRRYRDLQHDPSPIARAALYAQYGLWAWARELLERERAKDHEVPALLLARANWMCGEYEAARKAFSIAVASQEIPGWYAELCLSVGDKPPMIAVRPAVPRPPDLSDQQAAAEPLPEGILAASEIPSLKTMMGKEVDVEGIVTDSLWSRSGKVMNIDFAGDENNRKGLVCVVFSASREKFNLAFEGDVARSFSEARLRVHGKIGTYGGFSTDLKGYPQIILDEPKQVTIVARRPESGELPVPMSLARKRSIDVKLSFERALATQRADRNSDAVVGFTKVIELQPDMSEAWKGRGESFRRLNDFAKMAADYSEAIKLNPEMQWYWHERGYAYFMLGDRQKAIADYSKSIDLRDEEVEQRIKRGDCYLALGEFQKAEADYSRAIELDPAGYSGWFSRFQVNEKLGQSDKAQSDLARAVKLCTRPDDQNTLAWLLVVNPDPTLRDPNAAVELAEKATVAEPEGRDCWNTLGVARYRAGKWQAAVTALNKSMELRHGGDSSDWFILAMGHWQLNEKEDARIWYDKAVAGIEKKGPKNDELLRFRNEAEELLKPSSVAKPD